MFIVKYRKIFFSLAVLLVATAIASVFYFGLKPGTDFAGGTLYEVEYATSTPDLAGLRAGLTGLNLGQMSVVPTGERGLLIKAPFIDQVAKDKMGQVLSNNGATVFVEKSYTSIGPVIGQELMKRGVLAIVLVVLVIIIFLAIAFRHVGHIMSSWKYGVAAIVALLHDIIIPTGVAAYLGYAVGFEVDALFLTALLTTMALSVNDTIVVFDRVRENVKNRVGETFEETVGISLNQTFVRSLITSLTIIIALLALYSFGADSTRNFALIMMIGIAVGTYSSLFIASPLVVTWQKLSGKK